LFGCCCSVVAGTQEIRLHENQILDIPMRVKRMNPVMVRACPTARTLLNPMVKKRYVVLSH
jgi:hypothetical protein